MDSDSDFAATRTVSQLDQFQLHLSRMNFPRIEEGEAPSWGSGACWSVRNWSKRECHKRHFHTFSLPGPPHAARLTRLNRTGSVQSANILMKEGLPGLNLLD
jgi:hypothetical protein